MRTMFLAIFLLLAACENKPATPPEPKPGESTVVFNFEEDATSLLRNPCMGWGLYDDANTEVQTAAAYWEAQDAAARENASFFYIRYRWSDMEPEEGKYAWKYNESYKALVRGALNRGLKLCFRVYSNSQDNIRQSTPEYVRQAGAEGYNVADGSWTPYPDDPVFQEKHTKFIQAFAEEYDNPDVVDFIDGTNLGWWGENHHIVFKDPGKKREVFDWITSAYSDAFKKVLLIHTFASEFGWEMEKEIAIDGKGYGVRRDGLGSGYYNTGESAIAREMYGKSLFIGESCWWGCSNDDCRPWADDPNNLNSWRDVYELTYEHAMEGHFNTLDLREVVETAGWRRTAPDLVRQFMIRGGYRFYPTRVSLPVSFEDGKKARIVHTWKNTGNGYLPNNHPNWNYKYKPAFALLNNNGEVIKYFVDTNAEPSEWLNQKEYTYTMDIDPGQLPSGKYHWAVAIVDVSKNDTPGIKLAIKDVKNLNKWYVLHDFTI